MMGKFAFWLMIGTWIASLAIAFLFPEGVGKDSFLDIIRLGLIIAIADKIGVFGGKESA